MSGHRPAGASRGPTVAGVVLVAAVAVVMLVWVAVALVTGDLDHGPVP